MTDRAPTIPHAPGWRKGAAAARGHLWAALRGETGIAAQLIRGVSGSGLLTIVNTLATFATAVLLARLLGAEDYGIYAYAISWVALLGVFAKAGIDQVMIRNVAVYHREHDWAHIRGMIRFGLAAIATAGMLCALGAAAIAWVLHGDAPQMREALWIACLLLPLQAMAVPFGAAQQGLRQVVFAQLPGLLIVPVTFLAATGSLYLLAAGTATAHQALALRIGAVALGLVSAVLLLERGLKRAGRPESLPDPTYQARQWWKSAAPLVLMGSMFMVNANADILMLGSLAGAREAGVYKVATRGAELLTFSIAIVSAPLGPIIARLHAERRHQSLERVVRTVAWIAFIPTAALGAFFLSSGTIFLSLFGAEFSGPESVSALCALTIGQLVLAAAGPVGLLLVMVGQERFAARSIAVGAIANIGLNAVLIPLIGILGAAVATTCSTILMTFMLVIFSAKQLRINPTVIPGIVQVRQPR